MKLISIVIIGVIILSGCGTAADNAAVTTSESSSTKISASQSHYLPKAVVYRTNIPVDNHPAVKLSNSGNELIYFPDPRDIHSNSRPIALVDNWLLDRQGGISMNSRFLTFTYAEYAALPKVPAMSEILNSIRNDAQVTDLRVLDITLQDAIADTAAVNKLLRFRPVITVTP